MMSGSVGEQLISTGHKHTLHCNSFALSRPALPCPALPSHAQQDVITSHAFACAPSRKKSSPPALMQLYTMLLQYTRRGHDILGQWRQLSSMPVHALPAFPDSPPGGQFHRLVKQTLTCHCLQHCLSAPRPLQALLMGLVRFKWDCTKPKLMSLPPEPMRQQAQHSLLPRNPASHSRHIPKNSGDRRTWVLYGLPPQPTPDDRRGGFPRPRRAMHQPCPRPVVKHPIFPNKDVGAQSGRGSVPAAPTPTPQQLRQRGARRSTGSAD